MSTISCSYMEFRKSASSFLKKCNEEELSFDSLEAGNKCVILHYFGITDELTQLQTDEAVILLEMCGKKVIDVEVEEILNAG